MTRNQIIDGLSGVSLILGVLIAWQLAESKFISFFEFFLILIGINIIAIFADINRRHRNGR